ncbi:hypothetical protein SISNIDRAFT_487758 [Sistotremastrum niveocremeum HHB9708]|uniref:Uncharacterized protein n=1 Tax=Sistotremastrum niveocremeum HHB9708 TaxID=1314777 RepID=A0A164S145_9AGAM|nr:hypothetical protein SISNIDRAFT_487758 [Sistotremastrum niveocremeum HHB9708]
MFSKSLITTALLLSSAVIAAPLKYKARAALDFGSCSNPTIKFAAGLDGRNTEAFAPVNSASFNHGSALNIGVISSFICVTYDRIAAVSACTAGEQAASGLTGQAAADAFNAAVTGGSTSSSASSASSNATPDNSNASVTTSTEQAAATSVAASSSSSSSSSSLASSGSGNVQTFTGSLGGLPPPVVAGGKGFIVNGSQFIQKAGALGRSCDEQHNACADAANGGGVAFKESQCETQNAACHAAISA